MESPTLTRMSDAIMHRGPDDSGMFVSPDRRIGFGFRRLSIVDLSSAGHQPMQTQDGSVTIVFNGEIYNHAVLRKTLEQRGYTYRSRSDTETILYCYQEYGLDFVHKLLGMFAIAIWDGNRQRLVLARDRIGVKPLYYHDRNGSFVFGSEIKAILQHPAVEKEWNEEALEYYLTLLVTPAPITMFKNIRKLEPGHRIVVTKDGKVAEEQYWHPLGGVNQPSIDLVGTPTTSSPLAEAGEQHTEDETIDTVRKLLRQSIKDRMMSDVPFGVFLSGGIDSSTNVALMADLMNRPVDTFTVGFRDLEKYNELEHARSIAKQFRTNHHEIIIDHKDAFDFLPRLVWHQDEPLADPVSIPLHFVSKLARENGTIVVQVGEGSDELFAGYASMKRDLSFYNNAWKWFGLLPRVVKKSAYLLGSPALRAQGAYLISDYMRRGAEGDELFWGGAVNFTEEHKRLLLTSRRGITAIGEMVHGWHREARSWLGSDDYLASMIYLEFRHRLPELLLMRVDKVSMASSIEARVPFLDHRLVEYGMRIPGDRKINNDRTKHILKQAVEGLIPDPIINRPKQGFAAPVDEWMRGAWYPFVKDLFTNSPLSRSGILNRPFALEILESHRRGKVRSGQLVWNLTNLLLWHERWFGSSAS